MTYFSLIHELFINNSESFKFGRRKSQIPFCYWKSCSYIIYNCKYKLRLTLWTRIDFVLVMNSSRALENTVAWAGGTTQLERVFAAWPDSQNLVLGAHVAAEENSGSTSVFLTPTGRLWIQCRDPNSELPSFHKKKNTVGRFIPSEEPA